jgi:hypothetical protein
MSLLRAHCPGIIKVADSLDEWACSSGQHGETIHRHSFLRAHVFHLREIKGLGAAFALTLLCSAAVAQDNTTSRELEALRTTVQQLEKSLQDVRAKLVEMERRIQTGADTNGVAAKAMALQPTTPPATGSNYMAIAGQKIHLPTLPPEFRNLSRSPIPDYDTFNDQQAAPRPDNRPIDPELVGFIPIPGTKSMIRFGGSARLDTIYDFENNGNPNQFVPSSFPVPGQPGAGGGPETTIETKGTRISFEARRPVGTEGQLRIYNENDFFGDSSSPNMSFRVRHFYGQAWNLLIGQTFTTFMNIDSWPDVVDYAGPNAMINRRQPQIRYSPSIYEGVGEMHLLFSIEQPESDISTTATNIPSGAYPVSRAPDGVVAWRWEGEVGHVQVSGLFRSIGYDAPNSQDDQTVFGWGSSASGVFNLFKADKLLWQIAYGRGMARYVNDLGSSDLDAAPNNAGNLEAIPVFAATVGYTHQWSKRFRSTASFGYINVEPTASLGAFAIETTTYASANLVWLPTPYFRIGLEYLYGTKDTQSGADHDGHRLDFVIRYDLVR